MTVHLKIIYSDWKYTSSTDKVENQYNLIPEQSDLMIQLFLVNQKHAT